MISILQNAGLKRTRKIKHRKQVGELDDWIPLIKGHFLSDFAWPSFISYSFSRGKNFFVGKRYEITMRILALFVIVLGAFFFVKGVTGYF